jgi:hypothetical protein
MMEIDAARRPPLEQLAVDYLTIRSGHPSLDFCCRVAGLSATDADVARVASRLGVAVSTVRSWREIGRRARGWTCW